MKKVLNKTAVKTCNQEAVERERPEIVEISRLPVCMITGLR